MNASATKVLFHSQAFDAATRYAFDMEVTNWDRLDGANSLAGRSDPGGESKGILETPAATEQGASPDAFRRQHAASARLSLEEFDRYLVVESDGDGWIAVPRTLVRREQREASRRS